MKFTTTNITFNKTAKLCSAFNAEQGYLTPSQIVLGVAADPTDGPQICDLIGAVPLTNVDSEATPETVMGRDLFGGSKLSRAIVVDSVSGFTFTLMSNGSITANRVVAPPNRNGQLAVKEDHPNFDSAQTLSNKTLTISRFEDGVIYGAITIAATTVINYETPEDARIHRVTLGVGVAGNEIFKAELYTGVGSVRKLAGVDEDDPVKFKTVQTAGSTVAGLPASAGTGMVTGARAHVTDANATLTAGIGTIVAAGGANIVPVFYNGTNWIIG